MGDTATVTLTPDRLRVLAGFVTEECRPPFFALADALEALRTAFMGCGTSSGANGYVCGELPQRLSGPRMCSACAKQAWTAIATLIASTPETP